MCRKNIKYVKIFLKKSFFTPRRGGDYPPPLQIAQNGKNGSFSDFSEIFHLETFWYGEFKYETHFCLKCFFYPNVSILWCKYTLCGAGGWKSKLSDFFDILQLVPFWFGKLNKTLISAKSLYILL